MATKRKRQTPQTRSTEAGRARRDGIPAAALDRMRTTNGEHRKAKTKVPKRWALLAGDGTQLDRIPADVWALMTDGEREAASVGLVTMTLSRLDYFKPNESGRRLPDMESPRPSFLVRPNAKR